MLDGKYEIIRHIIAGLGGDSVFLGVAGLCRYCGTTDGRLFKKAAHSFPEALGNRWVFSNDECDNCNSRFSDYDGALAVSAAPFLTLGGVSGKQGVRQTGRSGGDSVIKSSRDAQGKRRLQFEVQEPGVFRRVNLNKHMFTFRLPIAPIPLRPRNAYKALSRMGVALLPDDELDKYKRLRSWLIDKNEQVDFPFLEVGMSWASVGNSPAFVCATLLRRARTTDPIPFMYLLLCMGSVCWQIDLMSDTMENEIPPCGMGQISINWSVQVGAPTNPRALYFKYGKPVFLNWSSNDLEPQPVSEMMLEFNTRTTESRFTPILRNQGTLLFK